MVSYEPAKAIRGCKTRCSAFLPSLKAQSALLVHTHIHTLCCRALTPTYNHQGGCGRPCFAQEHLRWVSITYMCKTLSKCKKKTQFHNYTVSIKAQLSDWAQNAMISHLFLLIKVNNIFIIIISIIIIIPTL